MQPLKNDFFIFFDILELSRKNFFLANVEVMGIQAIPSLLPTFGPHLPKQTTDLKPYLQKYISQIKNKSSKNEVHPLP